MNKLALNLEYLDKMLWTCQLGKNKHHCAAYRCHIVHMRLGLAAIIVNSLLGSALLTGAAKGYGVERETVIIAGLVSIIAAVLSGIQTLFKADKEATEHRAIGNQFLNLSRCIEKQLADYFDGVVDVTTLSKYATDANKTYGEIVIRSEGVSIKNSDYSSALKQLEDSLRKHPSLVRRNGPPPTE